MRKVLNEKIINRHQLNNKFYNDTVYQIKCKIITETKQKTRGATDRNTIVLNLCYIVNLENCEKSVMRKEPMNFERRKQRKRNL
jgi:hypothetical protein